MNDQEIKDPVSASSFPSPVKLGFDKRGKTIDNNTGRRVYFVEWRTETAGGARSETRFFVPGDVFQTAGGRKYQIARDGSLRRAHLPVYRKPSRRALQKLRRAHSL